MSDSFIGEIKMFTGSYAPDGWLMCDGKTYLISQFDALYSLIDNTYGGSSPTTFNVPDLRGRVLVDQGAGPALTPRTVGQTGGAETVSLTPMQMPAHTHAFNTTTTAATTLAPAGDLLAASSGFNHYKDMTTSPTPTLAGMNDAAIGVSTGRTDTHNNVMPYVTTNFIICATAGVYPERQ